MAFSRRSSLEGSGTQLSQTVSDRQAVRQSSHQDQPPAGMGNPKRMPGGTGFAVMLRFRKIHIGKFTLTESSPNLYFNPESGPMNNVPPEYRGLQSTRE